GKLLWLAGTTAQPVYHDHPHKRDQIQQYMVNDLEGQTRAAMDGIKTTLDAAGGSFKDVVHYFVFRARPRMGDIGKASAVINSYFAPFNHKPTSTNVSVLELGEFAMAKHRFSRREFMGLTGAGLVNAPWTARTAFAQVSAAQAPDLVVLNAKVYTVDSLMPRVEAFAVKTGRFVAVGSSDEVKSL